MIKHDCKNCIHSRTIYTTNETYTVCINDMLMLSFPNFIGECIFEEKENKKWTKKRKKEN